MARTRILVWILLSSFCITVMLLFKQGLGVPLRSVSSNSAFNNRLSDGNSQVLKMANAQIDKIQQSHLSRQQHQGETKVLTDAFVRCDKDHSSSLTLQEAEACINHQVTLHLTQALRDNFFYFTAVDQNPRNGVVSWVEYLTHYLGKQGYNQTFINDHLTTIKGLKREQKESIMRDKASWTEASRTDPDTLSLDEFLAFRHPESSHTNILTKVDEMLYSRDIDEDGSLTIEEFLEDGELDEKQFQEMDQNKDGKLDRREILKYMDPRHPHHSRLEATELFAAADEDKDDKLSLKELLNQATLFATSKMVDAGLSFHNEF